MYPFQLCEKKTFVNNLQKLVIMVIITITINYIIMQHDALDVMNINWCIVFK